jgi:hypothetical protein
MKWGFCDLCQVMWAISDLLECAACGNNFCPSCDPLGDYIDARMAVDDALIINFCTLSCKRSYEEGYRRLLSEEEIRSRSRSRQRYYNSARDDSSDSSSPIGR